MILVATVTTKDGVLNVYSDKGYPSLVNHRLVFSDGSWVNYQTKAIHNATSSYLSFDPPASQAEEPDGPTTERQEFSGINVVALREMSLAKVEFINHHLPTVVVEVSGQKSLVKLVKCQAVGPELIMSQLPSSGGPLNIFDIPNASVNVGMMQVGNIISGGSISIGGMVISGSAVVTQENKLLVKVYVPTSMNLHMEGNWEDLKVATANRVNLVHTGRSDIRIGQAVKLILNNSGSGFVQVIKVTESVTGTDSGRGGITLSEVTGEVDLHISSSGALTINSGQLSSLKLNLTGRGDVSILAPVDGDATLHVSSSGDIELAAVAGELSLTHSGRGGVVMTGSRTAALVLNHSGSGDLTFKSHFGTVDLTLSGRGAVSIKKADQIVRQRRTGRGDLRINY